MSAGLGCTVLGSRASNDEGAPTWLRQAVTSVSPMSGSGATLLHMVRVLHWNGKDLPAELRDLPAGRYVVESLDEAPQLDEDEEEGLRQALAFLRACKGRSIDQVRQTIDAALER